MLRDFDCSAGCFHDDFGGARELQGVTDHATFGEVKNGLNGIVGRFWPELVELEEGIGHESQNSSVLAEVEVDMPARAGARLIADGECVAGASAFPLSGLLTADLGIAGDGTDRGAGGGREVGGGLAADEEKREKADESSHI